MMTIDISAVPNQSFSVTINNHVYDIAIQQIGGTNTVLNGVVTSITNVLMAATIYIDNVLIVSGVRIVPGMPLLPYEYEELDGNFILLTQDDDYADYSQFGITQSLVYVSSAELVIIRSGNAGA